MDAMGMDLVNKEACEVGQSLQQKPELRAPKARTALPGLGSLASPSPWSCG